jgi:hypothetical protein
LIFDGSIFDARFSRRQNGKGAEFGTGRSGPSSELGALRRIVDGFV